MKKILKNKKGFTLMELIIVIAILAILAAILIPVFTGVIDDAHKAAAKAEAKNNYTENMVEALQASVAGTAEFVEADVAAGEGKSGNYTFWYKGGDTFLTTEPTT